MYFLVLKKTWAFFFYIMVSTKILSSTMCI